VHVQNLRLGTFSCVVPHFVVCVCDVAAQEANKDLYRVCQKSDTLLVSEFSTHHICNFCLLTYHFY